MSVFRRILDLSDPSITAAFQEICGIKTHRHVDAKSECNGVVKTNGNTGHYVAGSPSQNGSACLSFGCDSSIKTQGMNGHTVNNFQDISHENHINGDCVKQRKSVLKNGYKKPGENGHSLPNDNGVSNHLTCDKYHSDSKENGDTALSNGHGPVHKVTEDTRSYTIENYFLYYIFSFGASLGNEVFYIIFFSSSLWNFDNFVTRRMLILWCVIMYMGQALKDIIRWPRPLSPPAIRLETRYEKEYGMPSTHAMVGVAIPFGMLLFMVDRYEFNLFFGILFAVNWSILVSFSRLYLGMHSALDIIAGVVFAGVLLLSLQPFAECIDNFVIIHPWGGPTLVAVCLLSCLMYPSLDKWSTARGDTTQSLAVYSGIHVGLWMIRQTMDIVPEPEQLPYILDFPTWDTLWPCIQRQVLGVFILCIILNIFRWVMLNFMCWVWGLDPKDPKSKQTLRVELLYKYVAYFSTAFCATYLIPVAFSKLNIMRPSFYSEIFVGK